MTIDTNELRRLAQAAMHPVTKGRWMRLFGERTVYDRMEDGCRGIPVVSTPFSPPHPFEAACLDFIAAANPTAISELLDRLEAAEKEQEALRTKIARMERQEPVMWANSSNINSSRINKERGGCGDQHTCSETQTAYHDTQLYALPGAQPAPSVPDGWKLVPIEPTPTMITAALESSHAINAHRAEHCYRAMLAAAPEAKP